MASPTAYLDALLTTLDADSKELAQTLLSSPTPRALVDLLIRLAADSPTAPPINPTSPSFLSRYTSDAWSDHREQAQAELRRLHAKRKRSATPPPTPSKRARLLPATELPATPAPALPDPNDKPVFTLHALSLSSPMRKKLDITLHERSIRLGDASFALSALKRAFLLPTRGKSKPHWTVVLMSSDQVVKPAKGSAPATEGFQIVFGVDAEPSAAFASTAYPADKETHAKGSPTRPVLLEFLRRLPIPFYEPSADIFAPSSGGGLGIAAYRGAKEGTLWFLASGVLAENKPCEFWALEGIDDADDAIRLQSATGRTCTVFIRRKGEVVEDDGQAYEGEGEETDFGMVEGREQDGIRGWVRRLRGSFGKEASGESGASGSGEKDAAAGANGVAPMLDDDDDDSDFGVSSEDSDGGSPTESSDSDEDAAGSGGGAASGSGSEDESDAEDEGDDEEEERPLDPARHPLMRAGAMPKMNKAAMDMAVGMVVDELIGGHEVEQDGEEDELDD